MGSVALTHYTRLRLRWIDCHRLRTEHRSVAPLRAEEGTEFATIGGDGGHDSWIICTGFQHMSANLASGQGMLEFKVFLDLRLTAVAD